MVSLPPSSVTLLELESHSDYIYSILRLEGLIITTCYPKERATLTSEITVSCKHTHLESISIVTKVHWLGRFTPSGIYSYTSNQC